MSKIIKYEMMILLTEEFNDNELTKNFVERIAERLRVNEVEALQLLQVFHIFTKTPSASKKQVSATEELFKEINKDNNNCLFGRGEDGSFPFIMYYHDEICLAVKNYPYVTNPDGIIIMGLDNFREDFL